jgi:hypothetical protein
MGTDRAAASIDFVALLVIVAAIIAASYSASRYSLS